jgi:anti-sigma factor RsiW
MTHNRFIEMLNLYLDGALPPAEVTALENELRSNPERRRIYRQYCQIQNACASLGERFREQAAPTPHFRRGNVVGAHRRAFGGDWVRALALTAGGAAAACAVFVVVVRMGGTAPNGVAAAKPTVAPLAVASAPAVQTTTVAFEPGSAGFRNPWSRSAHYAVGGGRLEHQMALQRSPALVVPEIKLPIRSRTDALAAPTTPPASLRLDPPEETAFQFQR